MRALIGLVLVAELAACWPGHCDGALRAIVPIPSEGEAIYEMSRDTASFGINLDTNLESGPDVLAASGLDSASVLLDGPTGTVALAIDASVNPSAHSCASRGSLHARPTALLPPGDYMLVVLLDKVKWPALNDVTRWKGQRAMARTYHVR